MCGPIALELPSPTQQKYAQNGGTLRGDDHRSDHGEESSRKDISDLPYKETIVPVPVELPFASQMASFRSRIKISTLATVSRYHLVSDYATFPDIREAYCAGDMKSRWVLQGIKVPPLL
jgi:hypothetical protein